MNDFKFVSEKYDIKNNSQYRLSIQVNRDGFSVLINNANGEILQLRHYQTGSLKTSVKLLNESEELDHLKRLSFGKNSILINSTEYTLLPSSLADIDKKDFLLQNSVDITPDDRIFSNSLNETETLILFKTGPDFNEFTDLFKNNPSIKHISGTLIKKIYHMNESFLIYNAGNTVHFSYLKNKKLRFLNSFATNNTEELIFHCVNILKKQNPDPDVPVFYSGDLSEESSGFLLLKKYLPELKVIENELPFEIAGDINESYFLNLLELVS